MHVNSKSTFQQNLKCLCFQNSFSLFSVSLLLEMFTLKGLKDESPPLEADLSIWSVYVVVVLMGECCSSGHQ